MLPIQTNKQPVVQTIPWGQWMLRSRLTVVWSWTWINAKEIWDPTNQNWSAFAFVSKAMVPISEKEKKWPESPAAHLCRRILISEAVSRITEPRIGTCPHAALRNSGYRAGHGICGYFLNFNLLSLKIGDDLKTLSWNNRKGGTASLAVLESKIPYWKQRGTVTYHQTYLHTRCVSVILDVKARLGVTPACLCIKMGSIRVIRS